MVTLPHLTYYLEGLLQPALFKDYAPNGLQVEGKSSIHTLVTGVTACQALIDAAIKHQADAILVHHGFFWKNEAPMLIGIKCQRIKSLLINNISLLAYHLPLDAHLIYGNNIQLAKHLNIQFVDTFHVQPHLLLGCKGKFNTPITGKDFSALLTNKLGRKPLYIPGKSTFLESIAWCTGAAQDFLESAVLQQVDAYLTGEVSERTVHIARENGIHFFAAGHHATERYGINALGEHLSQEFDLKHFFIDIENPV